MADRQPFSADDPFDALAELVKRGMTTKAARILSAPEYRRASAAGIDVPAAMMAGALTATCGIVMAHYETSDAVHAEILAHLVAYLPQAMDNARSIHGLPPLPRTN